MYFRYELVCDSLRFRFAVLFVLKSSSYRIDKSCEDTEAADGHARGICTVPSQLHTSNCLYLMLCTSSSH